MIDANPPSELTAMDATYACLRALDATERGRVIAWARVCFVDRPGSYVLAHQNQPLGCNDSRFDCAVTLEREETEGYMPDQAIETTDAFSPDPAIADELLGDWTNPTKVVYYDTFDVTDLL